MSLRFYKNVNIPSGNIFGLVTKSCLWIESQSVTTSTKSWKSTQETHVEQFAGARVRKPFVIPESHRLLTVQNAAGTREIQYLCKMICCFKNEYLVDD